MTRKIAALVAAVAALGLAACAAPADPDAPEAADTEVSTTEVTTVAPAPSSVEPAPATPASLSDDDLAEMAYLNTVSGLQYPSVDEALMVGRLACALLDQGSTPEDLMLELVFADGPVVPGFLNEELPNFYGAAVGTFCRQHGWQLGLDFE